MATVVSFDFDGVLHESVYPGTIHPIQHLTWREYQPRWDVIELYQEIQKLDDVSLIIVSARENSYEIVHFCNRHDIIYDEIICTANEPKADWLERAQAMFHLDDKDIEEELLEITTEFFHVPPHGRPSSTGHNNLMSILSRIEQAIEMKKLRQLNRNKA